MRTQLKRTASAVLATFLIGNAWNTSAASYTGLVVDKLWVRDGQVIATFDAAKSTAASVAACHAAYSSTTDYKGILSLLLAAKTTGGKVTIYDTSGGASLQALIDSSEADVWSRPIVMVALE